MENGHLFIWSWFQIVESCCFVIFAHSVSIWFLVDLFSNIRMASHCKTTILFMKMCVFQHNDNEYVVQTNICCCVILSKTLFLNDCLWLVATGWTKVNLFEKNEAPTSPTCQMIEWRKPFAETMTGLSIQDREGQGLIVVMTQELLVIKCFFVFTCFYCVGSSDHFLTIGKFARAKWAYMW